MVYTIRLVSQNHRKLWVKSDRKRSPSPAPCHGQGHLSQDQVAQNLIHLDLEDLNDGASTGSLGNLFQRLINPVNNFFLYTQPKSTSFQFKTIALYPATTGLGKKSFSIFLISPLYILKGCNNVPTKLCLFQTEKPQLSQPVLTGEVFHLIISVALIWTCSNRSISFLYLGP